MRIVRVLIIFSLNRLSNLMTIISHFKKQLKEKQFLVINLLSSSLVRLKVLK